jgi:hypothetical protein
MTNVVVFVVSLVATIAAVSGMVWLYYRLTRKQWQPRKRSATRSEMKRLLASVVLGCIVMLVVEWIVYH